MIPWWDNAQVGFAVGILVSIWLVNKLYNMGRGYWKGWPGVLVTLAVWGLAAYFCLTHWEGSGPVYLDWPWTW